MSDIRDVVRTRTEADSARANAQSYGSAIEDGRTGDLSLAVLLATEAVCAEIRALATSLDHVKAWA